MLASAGAEESFCANRYSIATCGVSRCGRGGSVAEPGVRVRRAFRYGGVGKDTSGVQVHLGNAWIVLTRPRGRWASPAQTGQATQSLTVFTEDERHFERAKAEGAQIIEDLHVTEYGELQCGVVDLEGHHWLFSRHANDVAPSEWGARVAEH